MNTNCPLHPTTAERPSVQQMPTPCTKARLTIIKENENNLNAKVDRSIAYMKENINRPLRVSTLAAQVDLSQSHYFMLFKQQKGFSPMHYFTRLRMAHACRLLKSTTASIKQVAIAIGYRDPLYFSKVFKAVNNVPPSRYISCRIPVVSNSSLGAWHNLQGDCSRLRSIVHKEMPDGLDGDAGCSILS